MQRRRQSEEDLHNRERWLISYADFITLLFAFFVVMYSISSVNEGKYKVLLETMAGVFNAPQQSPQPVISGQQPGAPAMEQVIPLPVAVAPSAPDTDAQDRSETLRSIAEGLALEFGDLINRDVVSLKLSGDWLELDLPNSLIFNSGDAEPHYDAFAVIEKIAGVLKHHDNAIRVEGFTDDRPIRTARFPSNWELSAARAAAVVRMLVQEGIEPQRMAAVGYGEYQPVARNDTERGRRRNRRVVLLISRDADIRGSMR